MLAPGVILLDECGRAIACTPAASRILDRVEPPVGLPAILRSLHARAGIASREDCPVVAELPARGGGQVVLFAACADRRVTVVVEAHSDAGETLEADSLTPRERDVMELVCQGLPTKRIAASLAISAWTVNDHLRAIYAKSGVANRSQLMALLLTRSQVAA